MCEAVVRTVPPAARARFPEVPVAGAGGREACGEEAGARVVAASWTRSLSGTGRVGPTPAPVGTRRGCDPGYEGAGAAVHAPPDDYVNEVMEPFRPHRLRASV